MGSRKSKSEDSSNGQCGCDITIHCLDGTRRHLKRSTDLDSGVDVSRASSQRNGSTNQATQTLRDTEILCTNIAPKGRNFNQSPLTTSNYSRSETNSDSGGTTSTPENRQRKKSFLPKRRYTSESGSKKVQVENNKYGESTYADMLDRFNQLKKRITESPKEGDRTLNTDSCTILEEEKHQMKPRTHKGKKSKKIAECAESNERITATKVSGPDRGYIKETIIEKMKFAKEEILTTTKRIIEKRDKNEKAHTEIKGTNRKIEHDLVTEGRNFVILEAGVSNAKVADQTLLSSSVSKGKVKISNLGVENSTTNESEIANQIQMEIQNNDSALDSEYSAIEPVTKEGILSKTKRINEKRDKNPHAKAKGSNQKVEQQLIIEGRNIDILETVESKAKEANQSLQSSPVGKGYANPPGVKISSTNKSEKRYDINSERIDITEHNQNQAWTVNGTTKGKNKQGSPSGTAQSGVNRSSSSHEKDRLRDRRDSKILDTYTSSDQTQESEKLNMTAQSQIHDENNLPTLSSDISTVRSDTGEIGEIRAQNLTRGQSVTLRRAGTDSSISGVLIYCVPVSGPPRPSNQPRKINFTDNTIITSRYDAENLAANKSQNIAQRNNAAQSSSSRQAAVEETTRTKEYIASSFRPKERELTTINNIEDPQLFMECCVCACQSCVNFIEQSLSLPNNSLDAKTLTTLVTQDADGCKKLDYYQIGQLLKSRSAAVTIDEEMPSSTAKSVAHATDESRRRATPALYFHSLSEPSLANVTYAVQQLDSVSAPNFRSPTHPTPRKEFVQNSSTTQGNQQLAYSELLSKTHYFEQVSNCSEPTTLGTALPEPANLERQVRLTNTSTNRSRTANISAKALNITERTLQSADENIADIKSQEFETSNEENISQRAAVQREELHVVSSVQSAQNDEFKNGALIVYAEIDTEEIVSFFNDDPKNEFSRDAQKDSDLDDETPPVDMEANVSLNNITGLLKSTEHAILQAKFRTPKSTSDHRSEDYAVRTPVIVHDTIQWKSAKQPCSPDVLPEGSKKCLTKPFKGKLKDRKMNYRSLSGEDRSPYSNQDAYSYCSTGNSFYVEDAANSQATQFTIQIPDPYSTATPADNSHILAEIKISSDLDQNYCQKKCSAPQSSSCTLRDRQNVYNNAACDGLQTGLSNFTGEIYDCHMGSYDRCGQNHNVSELSLSPYRNCNTAPNEYQQHSSAACRNEFAASQNRNCSATQNEQQRCCSMSAELYNELRTSPRHKRCLTQKEPLRNICNESRNKLTTCPLRNPVTVVKGQQRNAAIEKPNISQCEQQEYNCNKFSCDTPQTNSFRKTSDNLCEELVKNSYPKCDSSKNIKQQNASQEPCEQLKMNSNLDLCATQCEEQLNVPMDFCDEPGISSGAPSGTVLHRDNNEKELKVEQGKRIPHKTDDAPKTPSKGSLRKTESKHTDSFGKTTESKKITHKTDDAPKTPSKGSLRKTQSKHNDSIGATAVSHRDLNPIIIEIKCNSGQSHDAECSSSAMEGSECEENATYSNDKLGKGLKNKKEHQMDSEQCNSYAPQLIQPISIPILCYQPSPYLNGCWCPSYDFQSCSTISAPPSNMQCCSARPAIDNIHPCQSCEPQSYYDYQLCAYAQNTGPQTAKTNSFSNQCCGPTAQLQYCCPPPSSMYPTSYSYYDPQTCSYVSYYPQSQCLPPIVIQSGGTHKKDKKSPQFKKTTLKEPQKNKEERDVGKGKALTVKESNREVSKAQKKKNEENEKSSVQKDICLCYDPQTCTYVPSCNSNLQYLPPIVLRIKGASKIEKNSNESRRIKSKDQKEQDQ